MAINYERAQKGYALKWDGISIKPGTDAVNAARFAQTIIAGEKQYRAVEAKTGWPWYFIGALHMRESSCNFKGVLHNGELIVGTKKKTRLVPAGRGPFATWVAAATDALGMKAHLVGTRVWCPALCAYIAEEFNGEGYFNRGINSPYDWAGSNAEQKGKYIRDHVWDANFDDPQIGVMTALKALCAVRPDVAASMSADHTEYMPTKTKVKIGGGIAAVVGGASQAVPDTSSTLDQLQPVINIFQNNGTMIGVVFTIAIVVGAVFWHYYEKSNVVSSS